MVKGGPINAGTNEKPSYGGQRVALAVAKSRFGKTAWCPLRFSFGSLEDGDGKDASEIVAKFELGFGEATRKPKDGAKAKGNGAAPITDGDH